MEQAVTGDDLLKLLGKKESLNRELLPFLDKDGPFGMPFLNHPLVQIGVLHEMEYARANAVLKHKKERVAEAKEKKDWHRFVFLHERPYRMHAFKEACGLMSDRDYWCVLGNIWTDSDNIWQHRLDWLAALADSKRNLKLRPLMMDREERRALAALPNTLTIYRGGSTKSTYSARNGLSWTLNLKTARWFAKRLLRDHEKPLVFKRIVPKASVLAHFTGRNEAEVLVLPDPKRRPQAIPG